MSATSTAKLTTTGLTDLSGKVALVTGGGTGIGLMMAKGLANHGAKVYISGRRFEVVQKAAAGHEFEAPGRLVPLRMDVTDKKIITESVEKIRGEEGKLDILINNAGTTGPNYEGDAKITSDTVPSAETVDAYGRGLFEQTFEQWEQVSRLNIASVFFVTSAFLGLLAKSAEQNGGHWASVINISSCVGHSRLSYGYYAYDCSKVALSNLTKQLATDFALKRAPIRVNAISPGTFPSELTAPVEVLTEMLKQPSFLGSLQPNPLRRPGKDEEIAALAVYLASPVSEFMTGQDIVLDAGFSLVNP